MSRIIYHGSMQGGDGMEAVRRYEAWLQDPLIDEGTKAELRGLAGNKEEIEDLFF